MLNINTIINNPEEIKSKLLNRGYTLNTNAIVKIYNERKDLIKTKENIAADKNKLNDNFRDAVSEKEKNKIKSSHRILKRKLLKIKFC